MSDQLIDNLKKDATVKYVLDLHNCPVCFRIMVAPIYQCKVGHLICSKCIVNLAVPKKCPSCRDEMKKPYIRSLIAEQISEKVTESVPFECIHEGCDYTDSIGKVREHENKCDYRSIMCMYHGCTKTFETSKDAVHHYQEVHSVPILPEQKGASECYEFSVSYARDKFHASRIIRYQGHYFLLWGNCTSLTKNQLWRWTFASLENGDALSDYLHTEACTLQVGEDDERCIKVSGTVMRSFVGAVIDHKSLRLICDVPTMLSWGSDYSSVEALSSSSSTIKCAIRITFPEQPDTDASKVERDQKLVHAKRHSASSHQNESSGVERRSKRIKTGK